MINTPPPNENANNNPISTDKTDRNSDDKITSEKVVITKEKKSIDVVETSKTERKRPRSKSAEFFFECWTGENIKNSLIKPRDIQGETDDMNEKGLEKVLEKLIELIKLFVSITKYRRKFIRRERRMNELVTVLGNKFIEPVMFRKEDDEDSLDEDIEDMEDVWRHIFRKRK